MSTITNTDLIAQIVGEIDIVNDRIERNGAKDNLTNNRKSLLGANDATYDRESLVKFRTAVRDLREALEAATRIDLKFMDAPPKGK